MRPWALLALLAVLVAPLATAQADTVHVAPGTYHVVVLDAADGGGYALDVTSDIPIDVLLVEGNDDDFVAAGWNGTTLVRQLNTTLVHAEGDFPHAGRWTLLLDNSPRPDGGANGTVNATVTVDMVLRHPVPVQPTPQGDDTAGSRNPWPVLMLTSPYWDLGVIGLGGMALWFLLLGALAAVGYKAGWDRIGVLVAGTAVLIAAWTFLPRGPVTQTAFPLAVAAGVAWLAYKATTDGRQALRMGFLAAGLGALLGVAVGDLIAWIWQDHGLLVVGADRFDDPVFMMSLTAGLGAFVLALIRAFVEASEDEEAVAAPASQGITTHFTVSCLRCGTPIKVDRSMKRYKVAMDRYEFPCPNCHAWMEWAEPKPDGAAAA